MIRKHGVPAIPPELDRAVTGGAVAYESGAHVNTGEPCSVFARTDRPTVLWLPDRPEREVVLQDGLEGEGEWLVATFSEGGWTVVRDYWDDERGESAEEAVLRSPDRGPAVACLVARLLDG